MFDPIDWYWRADDGRLFSSARTAIVDEEDEAYRAWLVPEGAPFRGATPWPRDDGGAQTDAALNQVLEAYGKSVSGEPPSKLSFLQFMGLFTEAEQMSIASAAMTDVATKLWYDRAVGAQFIDLGDERLAAGLQKMVDAKLLTASRRSRVLKGLSPA